jgi:hypothetical protein
MTIVDDPSLGMESSKSELGGGTTPFMAPQLLVPSKFGLEKCTPTKESDVYAMAMTVYQVLATQRLSYACINSICAGAYWDDTVLQIHRV